MNTLVATLLLLSSILAQDPAPVPKTEPAPETSAPSLLSQLPQVLQDCLATLQQPWECELTASGVQDPEGANVTLQGEGKLAFFYPRMFAAEFSIAASDPLGSSETKVNLVADDDFLNIELDMSDSPAGPMTQAFRISLDLVEELVGGGTLFSMMEVAEGVEGGSPSEIFEMAVGFLAAADISETEGLISLVLNVAELLGEGEGNDDEGVLEIQLQRGKKSAQVFPKGMSLVGEMDSSFTLAISKASFPESFAPERFEYKAPSGVMVMDITPMIRAQMSVLGGAGEEELMF